jgi:hypothetical protein
MPNSRECFTWCDGFLPDCFGGINCIIAQIFSNLARPDWVLP